MTGAEVSRDISERPSNIVRIAYHVRIINDEAATREEEEVGGRASGSRVGRAARR